MKNIKIGNKIVGVNSRCLIVAEISANHDSRLNNAIRLIKLAAQAGVDAVKIQTYKPETITLNSFKKDFLINKNSPWAAKKNFWNKIKKKMPEDLAKNYSLNPEDEAHKAAFVAQLAELMTAQNVKMNVVIFLYNQGVKLFD